MNLKFRGKQCDLPSEIYLSAVKWMHQYDQILTDVCHCPFYTEAKDYTLALTFIVIICNMVSITRLMFIMPEPNPRSIYSVTNIKLFELLSFMKFIFHDIVMIQKAITIETNIMLFYDVYSNNYAAVLSYVIVTALTIVINIFISILQFIIPTQVDEEVPANDFIMKTLMIFLSIFNWSQTLCFVFKEYSQCILDS